MDTLQQFYINGRWVTPSSVCQTHAVINPATEQPEAQIPLGEAADIDSAIAAATAAFTGWSETPLATRLEYLEKLLALYQQRLPEIADAISREMGAPIGLASKAQAPAGMAHLNNAIEIAREIAAHPMFGVQTAKRVMRASAECSYLEALDIERDAQSVLLCAHDFPEAMKAFSEKRKPEFKDR